VPLSQEDLFKLALSLQDPWYIKSIEFSSAKKQLDIHIDFIPGSRFECLNCKNPNNCIHDTKEKVWRHLNFFQFKAYIHARLPRTICEKCGSIKTNAKNIMEWRLNSGMSVLRTGKSEASNCPWIAC